jgi:hypothetical protein
MDIAYFDELVKSQTGLDSRRSVPGNLVSEANSLVKLMNEYMLRCCAIKETHIDSSMFV